MTSIEAATFDHHEAPTLTRGPPVGVGPQPLVLVVEDDPDTRLIYCECLTHMGYRTVSEPSGERGVAAAFRVRPEVVLMDLAMPGIGGIEATRRLKTDARTRDCRVIVVTAHGTSMFAEARQAGCDAYFCKPFNAFALDSVLQVLTTPYGQGRSPIATEIVKRCACGRAFTQRAWLALPLRGRMHSPQGGVVELRNCSCGSSIVLPV